MVTPMEADISIWIFNLKHDMNVLGSKEPKQ